MKMRGAVLLASALATLAIASAVAPPVQKHAVSPFNPAHFAPTSLMFCSSRVLPLRANHRSSRCPVLTTRASLDPPGFFKKFLVGFERLLVTITQVPSILSLSHGEGFGGRMVGVSITPDTFRV